MTFVVFVSACLFTLQTYHFLIWSMQEAMQYAENPEVARVVSQGKLQVVLSYRIVCIGIYQSQLCKL